MRSEPQFKTFRLSQSGGLPAIETGLRGRDKTEAAPEAIADENVQARAHRGAVIRTLLAAPWRGQNASFEPGVASYSAAVAEAATTGWLIPSRP
jgi:hypothetical protein